MIVYLRYRVLLWRQSCKRLPMRAAFGVWLELLLSRSSFAGCSVLVLNLGQGSRWLSFFCAWRVCTFVFQGCLWWGVWRGFFGPLYCVFLPPEAPVRSGILSQDSNVKRDRGRPKLTWVETIKGDLKE